MNRGDRREAIFRDDFDRWRFLETLAEPKLIGKCMGIIKSTGRVYRQNYVVFLRVADGKIAFIREYFDPVRAAKAMGLSIAVP